MGGGFFSSSSKPGSPLSFPSKSPSPSPPRSSFSETLMKETISTVEPMIRKWDLEESATYERISYLFRDNRVEAMEFLSCVNDLQHSMQLVAMENSSSEHLVTAHNLMQIAMKRLQKEFYTILSGNRYFLDPSTRFSGTSSAKSSVSDLGDDNVSEEDEETVGRAGRVPDAAVADLKAVAECMIGAGYGKECMKIYTIIRKSIVDETLYYLGVENLSSSQIQKMDWQTLDERAKNWLSAVKISVTTLFLGERILCSEVFAASEDIKESCFTAISKDAAMSVLGFAESVGKYKKLSVEKMFRFLDLYEAVSELWPEIESIFDFTSTSAVRSQAVMSLLKLGEAVRAMLTEFETAVQKDSSKPPPGGAVHPLTRYVMNYLVFLADYSGEVSEIVADWPLSTNSPLPESYFSTPHPDEDSGASAVSERFAWLVLLLLCKLDGKAQMYKDVPLSYLFLANNLNYVVSKVRQSNLNLILGSDWISTHEGKVKQYAAKYERMGWDKVLASFPENPTADISPAEANDCFTKFNSGFEEAYRRQCSWVIPDPKLRDQVKISLANRIVPGYRDLYEEHLRRFRGAESVVRFTPDDLQNYLSDLFHGLSISGGGKASNGASSPSPSTSPLRGR
nr:exocyst complex component EXO70A1-like [Ipomoea batatas]